MGCATYEVLRKKEKYKEGRKKVGNIMED